MCVRVCVSKSASLVHSLLPDLTRRVEDVPPDRCDAFPAPRKWLSCNRCLVERKHLKLGWCVSSKGCPTVIRHILRPTPYCVPNGCSPSDDRNNPFASCVQGNLLVGDIRNKCSVPYGNIYTDACVKVAPEYREQRPAVKLDLLDTCGKCLEKKDTLDVAWCVNGTAQLWRLACCVLYCLTRLCPLKQARHSPRAY